MKFSEQIEILRYTVKDTNKGENTTERYPDNMLIHWWNEGQRRMSTMRPVKKFQQATARTEVDKKRWMEGQLYRPEDCYRLLQVRNEKSEVIPIARADDVLFGKIMGACCYIHADSVLFYKTPIPDLITFYYDAYYEDIKDENSKITVPEWTIEALEVYVSMKVCEKEMLADARYRKFITKVDAGIPTNDPFLPNAEYFYRRFTDIINAHSDDAGIDLV